MNRIEFSRQTAEAVPLHAPVSGLPASAPDVPILLPRHEISGLRRTVQWRFLRPIIDAVGLVGALVLALRWPHEPVPLREGWPLLLFPPLVMLLLLIRGMYERRLRPTILDGVVPIAGSVSIAAMFVVVLQVYAGGTATVSSVAAHLWATAMLGVGGARIGLLGVQRLARTRGLDGAPTLIVGAGNVGMRLARRLVASPEYGLLPVGFLDANPLQGDEIPGIPVLGSPDELDWVAQLTGAEHVVIAFSSEPDERLVDLVRRCEALGLEVSLVPRLFESLNHRATYEPLGGTPLMGLRSVHPKGWQFALKHAFDRLGAALLVLLFGPLMAAIALAVRISSPGPVVFRQRRVGRDGTVFDLFKFRSMRMPDPATEGFRPGLDSAPGGVEGADRRTLIGRFLRRTSLDELPQFFNVLLGDMSLVGPRPERPEFVELFETDIRRYGDRHRVKSGVTGWAQVHGLRGQTSLSDRVEWDNYYIEHWTLGLDFKILAMTMLVVLRPAE
ncbi:exopolysaccharide biosynthesis polyprenyl glycosylphosphotransferase [Baekduia sp.]|uniref:exopolysaccharide biosynthesis polyprenyl glycosylphosphotransferase n=1 Tax=Baekduia sp. TaxID=2600305 RepID=UPI002E08C345|nr:exopolysaccharide biosynthesis polyprenyl glycosylphosphotransferase [Baekduia sp.]